MSLFTDALKRTLIGAAFALIGTHSMAAAIPAGVTKVTSVEGITEYRLESNGLRILLAPDESKPTTTVNMTYLVGSRHENYGETGMAHLLEHMLFKGTPTMPNSLGEFSKRGLQANGTTSVDRTNYYASFAANPDTLAWYLNWQADAMINASIKREDLDTEMTVVRNEMESGENNPFRILWQKMLSIAYEWHNYGKTPIGARSDVENVDIGQLRAFYKTYYQPDNAVLIVTGKFDTPTVLADVMKSFGSIPRPSRTLPPEYTTDPVQDGERSVILRRVGGAPLVAAMYHVPSAAHKDFAAIDLASMIVSDTPSGRLYKAMVPTKQAASVFGFTMDRTAPGTVMFGASLQPGMDQAASLKTLVQTLESLAQHPFTQEELDRVRNQWLKSWEQMFSDAQKVSAGLSEAAAVGDWRLWFLARDRIRAVTLAQVQQAADLYLTQSNRTEGQYIPTEKPLRSPALSKPDLAAELKDYVGDAQLKQAEAFDPDPKNIDQRTQRKTVKLTNGSIQLALLPKESRGERVQTVIQLHFGDVSSLKGQRIASIATPDLLLSGTAQLTRQQIKDRIDALGGQVSVSGSGATLNISLSTTRANIDALVQFVLDTARQANFPQAEVDEYKAKLLTSIKSSMTEPTAIATRMLSRHDNPWPKDDIRYQPSFDESLATVEALKRESLVTFHQTFYGAAHAMGAAVGSFDPASLQATLTASLNQWGAGQAYARIPQPYRDIKPAQMQALTPDKANAFYTAAMPLKMQDTDADYAALSLANFLLGTSETSRLWLRVREKEGLSYNVRTRLNVSAFEPSGSWGVYAIFSPENRNKVEAAIREEFERVLKDGFNQTEVQDGIKALLNYRKLARAQDNGLTGAWINYLDTGRTFAWAAELDRKLSTLSAEQVNTVIRKYLKPAEFSSVAAGDFEKKQ
ncbi:MAG: insulinase family protein [Burkholderiaceae bacterium]|nr:insulinase family protein [Burkholderiaceae bacterium]